eukprot:1791318-Pyramimonas_sp.AAC.1
MYMTPRSSTVPRDMQARRAFDQTSLYDRSFGLSTGNERAGAVAEKQRRTELENESNASGIAVCTCICSCRVPVHACVRIRTCANDQCNRQGSSRAGAEEPLARLD